MSSKIYIIIMQPYRLILQTKYRELLAKWKLIEGPCLSSLLENNLIDLLLFEHTGVRLDIRTWVFFRSYWASGIEAGLCLSFPLENDGARTACWKHSFRQTLKPWRHNCTARQCLWPPGKRLSQHERSHTMFTDNIINTEAFLRPCVEYKIPLIIFICSLFIVVLVAHSTLSKTCQRSAIWIVLLWISTNEFPLFINVTSLVLW